MLPSARVPGEFRGPVAAFVGVLFALTLIVLAIACSNVASMLLARAISRRREFATRLAVGAGRGHLVAQLLTETAALFLLAAVASGALAWWMVAFLQSFKPTLPVPIAVELAVDVRLLGFAFTIALVTSLLFGLAPALRATRLDIVTALHGQHSTPDRRRVQLRHVLVGAQVAMSLVLLVTTGLFLRTLQSAANADTGYDGERVRVFTVNTSLAGHRDQKAVALANRLLTRIGGINGVEAVAASRMIPLQGGRLGLGALRVPGYASPAATRSSRLIGTSCPNNFSFRDPRSAAQRRPRVHARGPCTTAVRGDRERVVCGTRLARRRGRRPGDSIRRRAATSSIAG